MHGLPSDWVVLTADHDAALSQFHQAVRRLKAERWTEPIAPGKWTPAEITGHIAEGYRVLNAELAGGPGMRVRVPPVQRWILRHVMLPRLLSSGRFPARARAPSETRPQRTDTGPEEGIATLSGLADHFIAELTGRAASGSVHLTHAYFGPLSVRQAVRLCAVHTRHHARQLEAASA